MLKKFPMHCHLYGFNLIMTIKVSIFFCSLLPDLLITCERHIKFIVLYRELLANTYLKDGEPSGGRST